MGAAVSTASSPPKEQSFFGVGDIVKAKVDGMFFEGVVNGRDEAAVVVDFGNGDVQSVDAAQCVRIKSWQAVETGDVVHVREERGYNNYVATVVQVSMDVDTGDVLYAVDYGDDDREGNVRADRIRKLASERSTLGRWKSAVSVVTAANAFRSGIKAKQGALDVFRWKIGDVVLVGRQEGIIEQIEIPGRGCLLYVADSDDAEWTQPDNLERIRRWDAVEVGDRVQARPKGERLWFDAIVDDIASDGPSGRTTYVVRWTDVDDDAKDDEALERGVPPWCIRKVQSKRDRGLQIRDKWKSARHFATAANAFASPLNSGVAESKSIP